MRKGKLVESGDIYKGTHAGWYSISDETFFSASQTEERDSRRTSIETGNEVIWEEEDNWKFDLPKYRQHLLEWIGNEQCKLCLPGRC